jgi:deoxyribonuclease V
VGRWPETREALEEVQLELAAERPEPWRATSGSCSVAAAFVAFSTRADPSPIERAWAAAVCGAERAVACTDVRVAYEPGYLAMREGPLLEAVVRELPMAPDVLLVNASGRDHPRGAGLALHLGAVLGVPTVGVTDRPLVADVVEERLMLGGEVVGCSVRTRAGARPVFAHAAWRTDVETARAVVTASAGAARTPEPLRRARFVARSRRARDEGRLPPGWQMDRLAEPRFPGQS